MSDHPTSEGPPSSPRRRPRPADEPAQTPAPPPPPPAHPKRVTAKIEVRELPNDTLPATAKPMPGESKGRTSGAIELRGEPPKFLGVLIALLMRKRRPTQYLQFLGALLALLAIGFLMLPKSWVSDDERRPPLAAPAQNVTIDETGAGVPETSPALSNPVQVMRFKAANADAWVSGVPIGAVRAKLILIDGRIHKLGEPIPPFNLRWQGRDAQDRIVFEGPDGVVRTRVL